MRVVVERAALAPALAYVGTARRGKTTLPVLEQVRLHVDVSGTGTRLDLACTDMDVWCMQSVDAEEGAPGTCATVLVNYNQLHDAVQRSPEGSQVEIHWEGGGPTADVRAGRSSFKLRTLTDGEFPIARAVEAEPWELTAKTLHDAIKLAQGDMYKPVKNAMRPYMQAEFLNIHDGTLRVRATDGYVFADVPLGGADGVSLPLDGSDRPGVMLPDAAIPAMLGVLDGWDGTVELRVTDSLIRMACGERALVSKLVDARFPHTDTMMRPAKDHGYVVGTKALRDALERAGVVLGQFYPTVELCPGVGGGLSIKAAGEGGDAFTDTIDGEVLGSPIVFPVRQAQLLGWLSRVGGETVTLHIPAATDGGVPMKVIADNMPDVEKLITRMIG